jgi:hypothetical protein
MEKVLRSWRLALIALALAALATLAMASAMNASAAKGPVVLLLALAAAGDDLDGDRVADANDIGTDQLVAERHVMAERSAAETLSRLRTHVKYV